MRISTKLMPNRLIIMIEYYMEQLTPSFNSQKMRQLRKGIILIS